MKVFRLVFVAASMAVSGLTQEPVQSPVEPKATIANFEIHPEFEIELVASEPQIVDPVAIRFDEYGNLWVVEMRDYPHGPKPGEEPKSRIKILRDEDKDGVYEKSHIFADKLLFATGIQPYNAPSVGTKDKPHYGVIVTLAGKVQWMSDTNGDFKADVVETWFEGFAEQNPQLRANDPTMGPDGWIYVANGLRNGEVKAVKKEWKDQRPVTLRSQDFRFHPKTGKCEAISGYGQFGMAFDGKGNRFVCSNRNPCNHVVLPQKYLNRNPFLVRTETVQVVSPAAGDSRVFAISKPWTTSTLHAGTFTAACGVTIYRGDVFPNQFRGNSFVCEPTGNLVHRDVLIPDGPTFKAKYGREGVEFLASRDNWFRPVNLANAPDGCLYVVDMYRAVIEHPQFMPTELKVRKDLTDGNDRGRIYRIVPRGKTRKGSRYAADTGVHPMTDNGWDVDMHLRRAYRTRSPDEPTVVAGTTPPMPSSYEQLLDGAKLPTARILALLNNSENPWVQQAVLTLPPESSREILIALVRRGGRGALVNDLCQQIALRNDEEELKQVAPVIMATAARSRESASLVAFCSGLRRRGRSLRKLLPELPVAGRDAFRLLFDLAIRDLTDSDAALRLESVKVLASIGGEADSLLPVAREDDSLDVRIAAIDGLRRDQSEDVANSLLDGFTQQSPGIQRAIVTCCVAKPVSATSLLNAVLEKRVPASSLDVATQRVLRRFKQPELKKLVSKALAQLVPADRKAVLADYADCVKLPKQPERGRIVFEKNCATCHKIGSLGIDIAPDIADSRSKTPEYLLLHILDPNRAVDSNYFSYTAVTEEGRVVTGIIASETATSVTLKQAEGKLTTLLRSDLEELKNNGVSLMPTGLEKAINKQQMADLISFIKNWRYLDGDIPIDLR